MRPTLWIGALCAALHLLAAQAEEPPVQPAAPTEAAMPAEHLHAAAMYDQYLARTIQALAATGKAREMALVAMMLYNEDLPQTLRAQRDVWWRTALDAGATDPMVLRMVLMSYRGEKPPETPEDTELRQRAARLWQTLEPFNLAAVLYQKEVPLDTLLAQAAASVHIDLHLFELGHWIHSTLRRYPPTAQELQAFAAADAVTPEKHLRLGGWDNLLAMLTVGTQHAVHFPDYVVLRNACKPDALHVHPTRKAACQHAANVLATRSTDVLQEMIGIRMLMDLASDEPECQRLKARGTRQRWRMQHLAKTDNDSYMHYFLGDTSIRREQDAMERFLRQQGKPSEPPPDWTGGGYTDAPC